jgi:hypothetical protein
MAETNQEVAERVRQELTNEPGLGTNQLWDIGKEMDPSLSGLSVQQFHGRYVLPVKRDLAAQREESGEPKPPKKARSRGSKRASGRGAKKASVEAPEAGDAADTGGEARDAKPGRTSASKGTRGTRGRKATKEQPAEESGLQAAAAAPDQGADRDRVRTVFLEFARDFSQAESRSEIVQVLSTLDEYVDRVLKG